MGRESYAVAVRLPAEEGGGADGAPAIGERGEMFGLLAELPDLWDINIADYSFEMGVSRFVKEGGLEPYMDFVKSLTSKPVVTVGRFTSPDAMVAQVRRGVVDFIGAARPSIADPFLPAKIEEGRLDDIRECIGCNICYGGNGQGVRIRCTQNPTMGEEWRRGWHPEKIAIKGSNSSVLVVGAGPVGLEAARALRERGYRVMLAEGSRELGGRVGLEFATARPQRVGQSARLPRPANSPHGIGRSLSRKQNGCGRFLASEADHVVIAAGATWRANGFGRTHPNGIERLRSAERIFTPDDIMAGRLPEGRVLIFDDDNYYMGPVQAELLAGTGCRVSLATPKSKAAAWSSYTAEQIRTQRRLIELDVEILPTTILSAFVDGEATLACLYTGRERQMTVDAVVMVTARRPNDALYLELSDRLAAGAGSAPPHRETHR